MPDFDHIPTDTAAGFRQALDELRISTEVAARLLTVNSGTIKRWKSGEVPVHPTAARMVSWLLSGYRPPSWPARMTGEQFTAWMADNDLDVDDAGRLFDVEDELIEIWMSDERGPPDIAVTAIRWIRDFGLVLPELQKR